MTPTRMVNVTWHDNISLTVDLNNTVHLSSSFESQCPSIVFRLWFSLDIEKLVLDETQNRKLHRKEIRADLKF